MAFVGGSLVPNGGHNLLEPAALGKPVLSGPHLFNFLEISAQLRVPAPCAKYRMPISWLMLSVSSGAIRLPRNGCVTPGWACSRPIRAPCSFC